MNLDFRLDDFLRYLHRASDAIVLYYTDLVQRKVVNKQDIVTIRKLFDESLPIKEKDLAALQKMVTVTDGMLEYTHIALMDNDIDAGRKVLVKEKQINTLQIELKEREAKRVNKEKVNYLSGIIFNDFVDNMEKIGDHLTNIAQGFLRHLRWDVEPE